MKINEVEKMTGLTAKAIRLYESKGLVCIARDENGYRNYSRENVQTLENIKLFRSLGVSVTDIKLYLCGVITLDEMMDKRKAEILKESGKNSEKYRICSDIAEGTGFQHLKGTKQFVEREELCAQTTGQLAVGIDIGTTTISAVVYDVDNKKQLEIYALVHNSYVCKNVRSEQSVAWILEKTENLLYHILDSYCNVISIGITGQMHGIVYTDKNGRAVSELANWQDKRGDQRYFDGESACEIIARTTGENVPTGYGIATHYCNVLRAEVPAEATGFCSIMDLLAMQICGNTRAVTHPSVAASFGLFDARKGAFMTDKLACLDIDPGWLPAVVGNAQIIGQCRNIPVCVAIGDNQASFLGAVRENADSVLVNIGTGSQVSVVSDGSASGGEQRPFVEGKTLACGSALCGGLAYAMTEQFFRSYAVSAGLQETVQYKIMNQLAQEAYDRGEPGLCVDVSFLGRRDDPQSKGAITQIDGQNFTPSALVLGVLRGMCNELYALYETFGVRKSRIVASGGAVKRNPVLQKLIAERFDMPLCISAVEEEAATGAALFSAFAVGKLCYDNGFAEYINYV